MIFHVSMEKAEDGWVVVECPALPGCISQGRDEQEALVNIKEAITAWMWAEDQKAVRFVASRTGRDACICLGRRCRSEISSHLFRSLSLSSRRTPKRPPVCDDSSYASIHWGQIP